jgi:hypothetical protein
MARHPSATNSARLQLGYEAVRLSLTKNPCGALTGLPSCLCLPQILSAANTNNKQSEITDR